MSEGLIENSLTNPKDLESLYEIDWTKQIRGETPENIKELCLDLCKDYLSGNWRQQTIDTIEVRRISGGMTNQLYYCAIIEPSIDSTDCVPQEVAIRLYGPKHFNTSENNGNERLTDVIIALTVSENKLGPKIYGLFENGQIQHYYKHRQFRIDEQKDPKLAELLFRMLARVHAMDIPIGKGNDYVFDMFDECNEIASKDLFNKLVEEYNCESLKEYDIKKEINWLKETILKSKSPQVFTHVDFRGSNVMVTEPNDEIVLCDFEYSAYGYRGFDLGTIVNEWNRNTDEIFKSEKDVKKFPNDSTLKPLISAYIEESEKIFGKKYSENKNNSLEKILLETKLFTLVNSLYWLAMSIKTIPEPDREYVQDDSVLMQFHENWYQGYLYFKDILFQEKFFEQEFV